MPLDSAELARTLNRVASVGQARAAAGHALRELHLGFAVSRRRPSGDGPYDRRPSERTLDGVRLEIESLYRTLPAAGTWRVDPATWERLRRAITRAHVELAGLYAAADHRVSWEHVVRLLAQAILQAPAVLLGAAGRAAGAVARTAGQAAGAAAGGVLAGLGLEAVLLLAGAGYVIWRVRGRLVG